MKDIVQNLNSHTYYLENMAELIKVSLSIEHQSSETHS